MKKFKETVIAVIVIIALGAVVIFTLHTQLNKTNRELAKRIAELNPKGGTPETIEALRQVIAIYEDQIERNVNEGAQTGAYWKILAIRLSDKGMYSDALTAFEKAIQFNGNDPVIFYLTGVAAARRAKDIVGFSSNADDDKARLFKLSETSYLRAIELDDTYARPMYGLAVLYVFELNRPAEAIPILERYIGLQISDVNAMAVLARAYFMTEQFARAIETYENIIKQTKDKDMQVDALNNIDYIQRQLYE